MHLVGIFLQTNEEQGAAGSDVASERMRLLDRMHQQQKQVRAVTEAGVIWPILVYAQST